MSFPHINVNKRTDEGFRTRSIPEHHREYSIIEELPINMINDFIIADSLHLLHLGLMKKCLLIWINGGGEFEYKWDNSELNNINQLLSNCRKDMPTDIHRSIRNLDCIKHWKGTEFRTFLMYIGIVILKQSLRTEEYEHFLKLYCAVILCSHDNYLRRFELAKELFDEYIEGFIDSYGIHTISSNVHNLSHVVDDVQRFGNLSKIDAYPFENALYGIKLKIRTCNKPLEQICRRLIEFNPHEDISLNFVASESMTIFEPELKYSIKINGTNEDVYSYVAIESNSFLNSKKFGDSWFLTSDNKIVKFHYATKLNGKIFLNGSRIKKIENFFSQPFSSKFINVYSAEDKQFPAHYYPYKDVKSKLICLHCENKLVFMPLLHTLK